jgi:hypothetical protein
MFVLAVTTTVEPPGTALPFESTQLPTAAHGATGAARQGGTSGAQIFCHDSWQLEVVTSSGVAVGLHWMSSLIK